MTNENTLQIRKNHPLSVITDKLKKHGMYLPELAKPIAAYMPYRIASGIIYTSGALPMKDGHLIHSGHLGDNDSDLSVTLGQEAARWAFINALAGVLAALEERFPDSSFSHLGCIVQIVGYVQCRSNFNQHHLVINGASELAVDLLGERGRHSRIAVGCASLPLNAPVEIAIVAEIQSQKQ